MNQQYDTFDAMISLDALKIRETDNSQDKCLSMVKKRREDIVIEGV